ncbi:hypothetical protein HYR54_14875 [Candidatus Acetothermia bacterium]|nr:hypothetical protein [Candidatus Acetothermia bacterium]
MPRETKQTKVNSIKGNVKAKVNHTRLAALRLQRYLQGQQKLHAQEFMQAVEDMDMAKMQRLYSELVNIIDLAKATLGIMGQPVPQAAEELAPTYVGSSWQFKDWFEILMGSNTEEFFPVSGVEHDSHLFLQRRCEVRLAMKSVTGVEADLSSMMTALLEMDRYGHRYLAHIHSHPFENMGKEGTLPSQIDLEYQQSLEIGQYPSIGIIFSRDRYFRFFSINKLFNIKIYGKGVEQIEDKVFRLVEPK